jgi:HPt (histidine-containing phosphotransfer) domain-containing protein
MYEDKHYQKLQEIISQTFDDVEDLLHRVQGAVSVASLKKLNETIEEIKKLRMGTNTEKITGLLEAMFEAMEKIEVEFLEFQKQNDFKLLKDSFVSNTDVFGEVNKYKKAVKVKEA